MRILISATTTVYPTLTPGPYPNHLEVRRLKPSFGLPTKIARLGHNALTNRSSEPLDIQVDA